MSTSIARTGYVGASTTTVNPSVQTQYETNTLALGANPTSIIFPIAAKIYTPDTPDDIELLNILNN